MGKSLAPPKRRWKYLHYRTIGKRQGWVVQFQKRTIGGLHSSETAAARTLMRELGVKSLCDLPRAGATTKGDKVGSHSAFRGVSFHKSKNVFVVNDAYTGRTFSTDREAAAARAEALGESEDAEKYKLRPQLLAVRMGVMRSIYFPQRGPQLLMSDLQGAIRHKSHSAAMYTAFPATEGISIQLKYLPWKGAVLQAWIAEGRPQATHIVATAVKLKTVLHDARVLRSLLVRAIRSIGQMPVSPAWSRNCSRSVGRHSSPGVILKHLGLLEHGGPLCFEELDDDATHDAGTWRLLTTPEEVTACCTKLAQFMYGWASIMAAVPQAPRTCVQWHLAQKQAFSDLKALPFSVPRLPTKGGYDYVTMWTVRTYMITIMDKEGIPRLKIDPDMWTLSFCKMNPDENNYLTRLYWSFRPKSVEELLERCGCSGLRPELFSMLACFCGDAALDAVDFSNFDRNRVQHWRQVFMAYHKREKVMCIPAVGCKLV